MVSCLSLEQLEHYRRITFIGQIIISVCPASTLGSFHHPPSPPFLYGYIVGDAVFRTNERVRALRSSRCCCFLPSHQMASPVSPLSSLPFAHFFQFYRWWQSMLFLLREISPAAKDGIVRPAVKSNECRCIYEMQASVYSNNFSQWGLSLRSTLRIDHLLNTSHLSCSLPSNLPQQKQWLISSTQFCTNLLQCFRTRPQISKGV